MSASAPRPSQFTSTELRSHGTIQAAMAAARAIEFGFGKSPLYIREGGSIPIVGLFKEMLSCKSILLMGWGSPDDGAHSPNERFSLEEFHRGILSAAALCYALEESFGG